MKKILLFLTVTFFATSAFAQIALPETSVITVEGKSSVKLMPEDLWFTVNLSVKDNNYTKCAEMAVEKMENIKKLFVKNGIDESLIKSNNYSIREIQRYDPETRQQIFDGYEANIPITIRTKRDYKKNDKIFELIKDNLESNFNLNFILSDEQMDTVKEKLISLAVKDAQQKVGWIAKSAEVKIGKIKSIQYGEPRMIGRFNNNMELMNAGFMPATRESNAKITDMLSPDEVEMQTSITVSWEIIQ